MRNYWIQLNEKKRKKIWTVEFSKNGSFSLKARRIEVVDSKDLSSKKSVSIIFKDAMFKKDIELMNFFSDAHHNDLFSHVSRLRIYQGLSSELENYELSGLSYNSLTTGMSVDDILFTFNFKYLKNFKVAS
jgi:hypothetical protein